MKRIIFFSTDGHEPTQRYTKRAVTSKQNIVASEFWTETQESRSDEEKISPDISPRSKETRDKMQFQDKKKETDRSNSKTRILRKKKNIIKIETYILLILEIFSNNVMRSNNLLVSN